jgi:hypothetical protein
MSNYSEMNSLERDSGDDSRGNSFPQEYSWRDDFEYIDTFLPRNIDF